ncbi:hypothetical protein [Streptomyces sp. NPDC005435]|uniref:hypothetical protein n=1 Tax=Streptomyces sp. NPDC005435 TaxID=3154464 RepID=UPI003453165C
MARQLACGMGSFFEECGCSRPTHCPHPYTIRFRDALGKQREEVGYDAQDDAIERLTQIYAERKTTEPSVAQDDGVLDGLARGKLQVNIFRVLKAILRDAYSKGAVADDPVKDVQEPEYAREKVVIPSLTSVKKALTVADEYLALEIVMMVGCGLRNGEARAGNINNVVADDVYRCTSRSTPTRTSRRS